MLYYPYQQEILRHSLENTECAAGYSHLALFKITSGLQHSQVGYSPRVGTKARIAP